MHKSAIFTIFIFIVIITKGCSEATHQRQQVATLQCFTCENCVDDDADQLELAMCSNSASIRPTLKTTKKPAGATKKPTTTTAVTDSEEYEDNYGDYGEDEREVEIVRTTKKATTKRAATTTTKKTTPRTTTKIVLEGGDEDDDDDGEEGGGEDEDGEEYGDLKIRSFITTTNNPSDLALEAKSGTTTLTALATPLAAEITSTMGISTETSSTQTSVKSESSLESSTPSSLALSSNSVSQSFVSTSSTNSSILTSIDDSDYYGEYEDYKDNSQLAEKIRMVRQATTDEHVCYTIKLHRNKKVITNRGCATLVRRNKYLTCQALSRGLPIKDCHICDTYGCNGFTSQNSSASTISRKMLSKMTSLLLIYLMLLFRSFI